MESSWGGGFGSFISIAGVDRFCMAISGKIDDLEEVV